MLNPHDHNLHVWNEEQEVSDQEPYELGSDDNVPVPEHHEYIPDEEDNVEGIPSNIWTLWETGKFGKLFTQKPGKRV